MFKNKVYLSIGSNIGDKESNIASSIAMLGSYIEISKIRSSSFYKTEPLYNENQPSFLNIVLELETTLTPFQLLDKIHEIEKMLGREEKRQKNQPRTIDIDIIIFKDSFIDTIDLQIPHPGALFRKFVLIPLSELASNEIFPKTNIKIVDLLEKCTDTSVVQKYIIDKKA
jgi:2-amino-4-hydroxy-6-hydroxymethyldihydropteridine diphosphokinase